ncbi:hypothetical protein [Nocardiopsis sp. RV163]|uniref:hypothetical protein n=1 Tax=Nocardiopsis sp. RV163 TaxID=1661388 RepID=UPI00064BC1F9|nr:hypothetical protein [Nocardiopsis sp. RV163]
MVERVTGPGTDRETESDRYRASAPGTGTGPRAAEPVTVDAEVNDPRPAGGQSTGPAGAPGPDRTDSSVGGDHTGPGAAGHARPGGRGTAPGRVSEQPGAGADRPGTADGTRSRGAKLERVRERWNATQGKFVDDPHGAVREADALAAEVADAVVAEIEERRSALRSAWNEGEGTDTESLRVALRDYRSFVEHLVNTNT